MRPKEYHKVPPKTNAYPPYIIWNGAAPVFRVASIEPNKVVDRDPDGTIVLEGLQYPSKLRMMWRTRRAPPGFLRKPYATTY